MASQREIHENFQRGSVLQGPPDLLQDTDVRFLKNSRLDRTKGTISSRPGLSKQTASALGGSITSLHKRYDAGGNSVYAQVGSTLYRLPNDLSSSTSISTATGTTALSAADLVDGKGNIWSYFCNGAILGKDNGASLQTWGIAAPANPPTAVALATDLTTTIDALDNAASWTGTGLSAGPTNEANILQQGAGSVTFTIAANTLGSIGIGGLGGGTGYLDLDTLSGGNASVKDDDYIHLWLRCDRPDWVDYVQLDFDLDTQTLANAFRNNYYSIVLPSLSRLNQGRDQWTELQIRKSQFQRFGTSAALNWSRVKAARISALTTPAGAVTFYADDLKLRGGTDIEGVVEYTVAYRNSVTGGRGNPPLDSLGNPRYTTKLTVNRQRVSITTSNVVSGGGDHPVDAQINTIILYRRIDGGNSVNIVEVADTTVSPYVDSVTQLSTLLNSTLEDTADSPGAEFENDPPPSTAFAVFGPGATQRLYALVAPNKVYFSKPFERNESRGENWPPLNFALAGSGSEQALAGIATDTQVLVFTDHATYQLVGQGEVVLPVEIPNSRPIVGKYALDAGDGYVFFMAPDGLYQQSGLTQVRVVDVGETLRHASINLNTSATAMASIQLQWHSHTLGPYVCLLIPTGSSTTPNARLVVKKSPGGERYESPILDTSTDFTIQSLLADDPVNGLLGGGSDGNVYSLEETSVNSDNGTGIAWQVDTKSHNQQAPNRDKQWTQILAEANTNGQSVTVTALYDKAASTEALGTFSTTTDIGDGRFTPSDPLAFHQDLGLRFSATLTSRVDVFRYGWYVEVEPEAVTYWDSLVLSFPVVESIKRFNLVVNGPGVITLQPTYDGVAGAPLQTVVTNGKAYQIVWCPANVKARTVRVTLTSSTAYRLYSLTCRSKPLGALIGYREQPLLAGAA